MSQGTDNHALIAPGHHAGHFAHEGVVQRKLRSAKIPQDVKPLPIGRKIPSGIGRSHIRRAPRDRAEIKRRLECGIPASSKVVSPLLTDESVIIVSAEICVRHFERGFVRISLDILESYHAFIPGRERGS